jgi:hypothetical protein
MESMESQVQLVRQVKMGLMGSQVQLDLLDLRVRMGLMESRDPQDLLVRQVKMELMGSQVPLVHQVKMELMGSQVQRGLLVHQVKKG